LRYGFNEVEFVEYDFGDEEVKDRLTPQKAVTRTRLCWRGSLHEHFYFTKYVVSKGSDIWSLYVSKLQENVGVLEKRLALNSVSQTL